MNKTKQMELYEQLNSKVDERMQMLKEISNTRDTKDYEEKRTKLEQLKQDIRAIKDKLFNSNDEIERLKKEIHARAEGGINIE